MYVTVHLGYLDVSFEFRPFESHFEIHSMQYLLSASGEGFLQNPSIVMSVDPQCDIFDIILGVIHRMRHSGNPITIKENR